MTEFFISISSSIDTELSIGIGLSEFIILVEKQTAAQILYTINRPQNMLCQSKSCQLLHKCSCLQCFDAVGWRQERHPVCKKTEQWGAGVVICLD